MAVKQRVSRFTRFAVVSTMLAMTICGVCNAETEGIVTSEGRNKKVQPRVVVLCEVVEINEIDGNVEYVAIAVRPVEPKNPNTEPVKVLFPIKGKEWKTDKADGKISREDLKKGYKLWVNFQSVIAPDRETGKDKHVLIVNYMFGEEALQVPDPKPVTPR